MYFCHSDEIWRSFPELVVGTIFVSGISRDVSVAPQIARYNAIAESRLATNGEGQLPEIQAWRRAFSRMGLKPTQYRCAAEALLRRFRKEKSLPSITPLVDLCNAISLAFAIPVAAFDVSKIAEYLEVRHATGREAYLAFSGEMELPEVREVVFADSAGRAHARRWSNRQSAYSAVRDETSDVLIVAEAMHESGTSDIATLMNAIVEDCGAVWSIPAKARLLNHRSARFDF